jgi:hypothetical protein
MKKKYFPLILLFISALFCLLYSDETLPVAHAGLSRYAAGEPIVLDGSKSHDPTGIGDLTFLWSQVSGPALFIENGSSATPTISGFVQASEVQECVFKLIVSSAGRTGPADYVSIFIVPDFGEDKLDHVNPPFDADKPTIFSFGGGNGISGGGMIFPEPNTWFNEANFITVNGYNVPYGRSGDMLIVYFSRMAPDYKQPIQTLGFSTGGKPAIIIANYLNQTYKDPRYAVNRVSLFDSPFSILPSEVADFNAHPVGGEPAWVDNYMVSDDLFIPGALNVIFPGGTHSTPVNWYTDSASPGSFPDEDVFNNGVTAGAYLSVIGPAKNMQLAVDATYYYFRRIVSSLDYLEFSDAAAYPGRFPEAVILVGAEDREWVDETGALLTCKKSANAVGYRLLFGEDPGHMEQIVSDTPAPPMKIIKTFPYEKTYWTIKVRDRFGTTVFADPRCIHTTAQKISPSVSITAPAFGATLMGQVEIRAAIQDDSEISRVNFYVDGILIHQAGHAPYVCTWDTTSYLNDNHVLKVTAYDTGGSYKSARHAVRVRNLGVTLSASRGIEKGWILRAHYARLDISFENPGKIKDVKYIIYRGENGRVFRPAGEISDSQFAGGTYTYFDKPLEGDKPYSFKVTAVDTGGRVLAVSDICDI